MRGGNWLNVKYREKVSLANLPGRADAVATISSKAKTSRRMTEFLLSRCHRTVSRERLQSNCYPPAGLSTNFFHSKAIRLCLLARRASCFFLSDECMRCELRTCGWFGVYICTPIYLIRPLCVLSDANGVCMTHFIPTLYAHHIFFWNSEEKRCNRVVWSSAYCSVLQN